MDAARPRRAAHWGSRNNCDQAVTSGRIKRAAGGRKNRVRARQWRAANRTSFGRRQRAEADDDSAQARHFSCAQIAFGITSGLPAIPGLGPKTHHPTIEHIRRVS